MLKNSNLTFFFHDKRQRFEIVIEILDYCQSKERKKQNLADNFHVDKHLTQFFIGNSGNVHLYNRTEYSEIT